MTIRVTGRLSRTGIPAGVKSIFCYYNPIAAGTVYGGVGRASTGSSNDNATGWSMLGNFNQIGVSKIAGAAGSSSGGVQPGTVQGLTPCLLVLNGDGTMDVYIGSSQSAATTWTPGTTSWDAFDAIVPVGDVTSGNTSDMNVAEFWMWSSKLTATDWATLKTGVLPETVKTSDVVAGWYLKNPGEYTDAIGGLTLTATGTVVAGSGSFSTHPVTRSTPATAVTLSGPSSGTVGVASTNFTVGANGTITGTVTVTPSDGGAGGTFSPTSVNISSGTPTATFTYTAASSGAKTISATNNGALTNPSSLTYTASGGAATAVTLSGPSGGSVGVASSNFTVGANGTISGTVTVTPSDSGGGGSFSPTSVNISSGTPTATFTYTPASAGAKSITVTNNGGLSNPAALTYTASALPTLNFQAAGMEFGRRTGLGLSTFALDAAANYRYSVHADGTTLGAAIYSSGVVATDSGGKLPNLANGSLSSGSTYRIVAIRQADGEACTFRMVAA